MRGGGGGGGGGGGVALPYAGRVKFALARARNSVTTTTSYG